jgi:hypothetical protein
MRPTATSSLITRRSSGPSPLHSTKPSWQKSYCRCCSRSSTLISIRPQATSSRTRACSPKRSFAAITRRYSSVLRISLIALTGLPRACPFRTALRTRYRRRRWCPGRPGTAACRRAARPCWRAPARVWITTIASVRLHMCAPYRPQPRPPLRRRRHPAGDRR